MSARLRTLYNELLCRLCVVVIERTRWRGLYVYVWDGRVHVSSELPSAVRAQLDRPRVPLLAAQAEQRAAHTDRVALPLPDDLDAVRNAVTEGRRVE